MKIGIIGASGYTGAELLRLCAGHPHLDVHLATGDSQAGKRICDLYPSLAAAYGNREYDTYGPDAVDGLDLVFIGLPHGVSQTVVPDIVGRVGHVVDLGSDFRLHDPGLYPSWYGSEHLCPDLLDRFVYGLPELFRPQLLGAELLIAATGCNAATAVFALAPLLAAGLIEGSGIVVNLVTGVSGAGRPPKPNTTFCTVDEDVQPYALLTHRHTPEIEQALTECTGVAASVLFTPHLAPMNRGIIATCYGRPTGAATSADALAAMTDFYAGEPFMVVDQRPPSTKATMGSNTVHLTARVDPRTGIVMGIATLDNLMKGASGMAVQNANLALGLPETTGLPVAGVYP